ncbi:fucose-1-phosphate guanylyltransferase-like [Octopus sinensis]|uniref:Fucose-1-phosphate guanylyltransferase-like n=1 Tax=Octopus sinensis TaxID=2607531 RepID=A0A6P7T167_9MOLL|nr:fucose-1-phosphate guanylyltransferase-like [Octopus sinensis]
MDSPQSTKVVHYMQDLFSKYDKIRGQDKNSGYTPFWDAVVITTADKDQKQGYQLQIEAKRKRNELPLNLEIHVITDPPGVKLGNGGATFTALSFLEEFYGDKFFSMKILLIHAGGLSKRLPSNSILGKIFSVLPCGIPCYQMLDIKLALYWPFVPKMNSGIFLTCADDIITYNMDNEGDWSLKDEGFTALAHPSSIEVGTGHGVYIVKEKRSVNESVQLAECTTVLQKPSIETMRKLGAVIDNENDTKNSTVYTDSAYFFTSSVSKMLLTYAKSHGPFNCEIDAYGDFLQALGTDPLSDYVNNLQNITTTSGDLLNTRKEVFKLLKGTPLNLIILNSSQFFHIGSMPEMLHNFCKSDNFKIGLGLSNDAFNVWLDEQSKEPEPVTKRSCLKGKNEGCLIHSLLPVGSCISSLAVLEFCNFDCLIHVSKNCLLSNCEFLGSSSEESQITIPENTFMHTIPVTIKDNLKYVTIVFHIKDNLKKSVPLTDFANIPFLGDTLGKAVDKLSIPKSQIVSDKNQPEVSLWNVNIFPLADTMSDSFQLALAMSMSFNDDGKALNLESYQLVSINSILKYKSIHEMLKYRQKLFDKINTQY